MTETLDAPTKLELLPKLGLEFVKDALPWLQVTSMSKRNQVLSNVKVKLTALCVTPDEHGIVYLECCATSSAVAHCIMAASVESDGTNWAFCPSKEKGYNIHPLPNMRVADVKLKCKGHAGLHHFAIMAPEDSFILADGDDMLWLKLRRKLSCPTKPEWGDFLLEQMARAMTIIPCESFGLPENISVYVLHPDADATFDRLCGDYVKENGL